MNNSRVYGRLLRDTLQVVKANPVLERKGFRLGSRYKLIRRAGSMLRLNNEAGEDMGWVEECDSLRMVYEEFQMPEKRTLLQLVPPLPTEKRALPVIPFAS